ncbi:hypothetical protein IFO70_10250 [Phormidium tenue FACHB-886]|nr:hypothetical protein [Phormidium tenue FACHB-886]
MTRTEDFIQCPECGDLAGFVETVDSEDCYHCNACGADHQELADTTEETES